MQTVPTGRPKLNVRESFGCSTFTPPQTTAYASLSGLILLRRVPAFGRLSLQPEDIMSQVALYFRARRGATNLRRAVLFPRVFSIGDYCKDAESSKPSDLTEVRREKEI